MQKIAFIDRDGTLQPEHPALTVTRMFHQAAFSGGPRQYVRRLVEECNVAFVWNSHNPDRANFRREAGRLHSMNERRSWHDPVREHLHLLEACGIEQAWLYPGHPEVLHSTKRTKGQAMCDWLNARQIDVNDSVAFDDHVGELDGYPADRIIAVDPRSGITWKEFRQARILLGCAPASV